MSLKGDHILVTGASSGLGRAIATKLASQHGATVIATARREDKLRDLQSVAPDLIKPVALDLMDRDAIVEFCANLTRLDGAILNAGVTAYGSFRESDPEMDQTMIATNATANVLLTRSLLPKLEETRGRLLFVGSVGGLTPLPHQAVYSATKAFLHAFALALREEVREQGVTVGVFAPGGIKTEMTDDPALDHLRGSLSDAENVAKAVIKAYANGDRLTVPGLSNKTMAAAIKVLPQAVIGRAVKRIYSK